MSNEIENEERRKFDRDHDLLLELKGILLQQNEVMKAQKESFSYHVNFVKDHIISDEKNFFAIWKTLGQLRWYVAIGTGIVITFEFASKFILPKQ